jgi:threonine/homoserine/homoserine lactone efflux protein
MDFVPPQLSAGALGLVAGFIASIPGGPVNATIVGDGARHGFRWVAFVGIGAVAMESIYCALAFAGFASVFEVRVVRATMELVSFLLMLWLGVRYLRGTPIPGEAQGLHLVEQRFHPHTGFWTGFLRVLANPGLVLLWVTVAATLLSRDWIENTWTCKWPFIGGVAVGGLGWFLLVGWGVTHKRGRISPQALKRLAQASGVFLLVVAAVVGVRLIGLLAERHR